MDNIFDEEKFKKEQEDANFKKGLFGALGTVAQGFSNVPSSHELLYGGKSYRPDVKGSFDALAKGVEDPSERRAKLYADFKGHKEMLESKKKDAEDALLDNRESTRTKSLLQFGKQRGMQIDEKTTGRDVLAMYDPKKIHESEADFERQSKLNEQKYKHDTQQGNLDRQADLLKTRTTTDLAREEKMQGLETPYGYANNADDAKQIKDAHVSKKNFDTKLGEMITLRTKHGGGASMNREDVARGKQLSKDLLLEYKNMAKLGVLSQSDEAILNEIIPEDPLAYNSPLAAMQGQDPILHKLKKFKGDSDTDFSTRVGTRTRQGLKTETMAGQLDPDAKKYADMHGIDYAKAADIVGKRKAAKQVAGGR